MMKTYSLAQARKDLPVRKNSDSKTRGGKCLMIAGSPGMWGAGLLCSRAAARSGAGYVYLFHAGRGSPFLNEAPDLLAQSQLSRSELARFDAVAIGPGLAVGAGAAGAGTTLARLRALIRFGARHVVVDASALTALAQTKKSLSLPPTWILTPHEGELGRLIGVSAEAVRAAREKSVRLAQTKFGCVVILKGHGTLVADSHGVTKILAGNPALAKAGTGDVLTGIITAFLAQGLKPKTAACLGAFVHGRVADRWISSGRDQLSLMASDVIEDLPMTLASIRTRVRNSRARKR